MKFNKLTSNEEFVIVGKGTEPPFSGIYHNYNESGTYICRRCNAPLFHSIDKFDSGCGWPSFDDEIPDAIIRSTDADGFRTEISCAVCNAHLGHIFEGEGFTTKNIRHCVNSISLDFIADKKTLKTEKAYFAGGCFWGIEHLLKKQIGVVSTRVGYMGGHKEKPTYNQVCNSKTGHVETVEIEFDKSKTDFEKIARMFFEIHDPTQVDRQGPDIGEQYRSAIFYTNENQKKVAEKLIDLLKESGHKIVTELTKAGTFWEAEDYHQDYYELKGKMPYCHFYTKRF